MAADMNNVARAHASMAVNPERMQNVPAFNQETEILQAIVHCLFVSAIVSIQCKFTQSVVTLHRYPSDLVI